MKTTIDISDPLLDAAKAVAAREGITLKALVELGLREVLESRGRTGPFRLRKASFRGNSLRPDAEELSREKLRELAYGERGTKAAAHADLDSLGEDGAGRGIEQQPEGKGGEEQGHQELFVLPNGIDATRQALTRDAPAILAAFLSKVTSGDRLCVSALARCRQSAKSADPASYSAIACSTLVSS